MKKISSRQNPEIKLIQGLKKKRNRDKQGLFLVEGKKELKLAIKMGYEVVSLNFSPGFSDDQPCPELARSVLLSQLSPGLFSDISYRESPDGYLAVVRQKAYGLQAIAFQGQPFLLVLENIEKPGNLGAILRTADACGVDAVLVDKEQQTDLFNPNVIRASLGAFFTTKVVKASKEEIVNFLAKHRVSTVATTPGAKTSYFDLNYRQAVAVLVGEEHLGLSRFWLQQADFHAYIPMSGQVDSLNASVSAAVLSYEVVRQRLD